MISWYNRWVWPVVRNLYKDTVHEDDLFENRNEDGSKYLGDALHRQVHKFIDTSIA